MDNSQRIAVIIPTVLESTLDKVVEAVHNQMPVNVEIIVVGFGTARHVAQKHAVRFMDVGRQIPKSILLNRVIERIDANAFIVLDADAIPQPGWAEEMLDAFQQGKQLFSASIDVEDGPFWMRVYNLSMLHEFTPEKSPTKRKHLPAISLGFTRSAYNRIGSFREDLQRSQDFEWTLRATKVGLQPCFVPTAIIVHHAIKKNSFRAVMKFWHASGYDNWRVRLWHADILNTPRWLRNPLLVLIFSPLLAIVPTLRIIKTSPSLIAKNLALLPFIYLTKLVWCWGLYFDFRKAND